MENQSLLELLEQDREMILASLAKDRSLGAAQTVLEKAVDRVMYRYVEQCRDPQLADGAQYLLQTMKNTLPLIDAVGEAREWKKTFQVSGGEGRLGKKPMLLLLAGSVLVLAAVLAGAIASPRLGLLSDLAMVVIAALGGVGLYFAGRLAVRPVRREKAESPAAVRTEFLVDIDKAWHCLRGAVLMADGQLNAMAEAAALQRQQTGAADAQGPLPREELELFASLLESAYAAPGEDAREMVSAIRFFLHSAQIDVQDYEAGRESWFEFLPSVKPGTLRPALASNGRLVKKGLAAKE